MLEAVNESELVDAAIVKSWVQAVPRDRRPEVVNLLEASVSRLAEDVGEIIRLSRDQHLDEARQQAHRIRGSASNYGLKVLCDILLVAEERFADGRPLNDEICTRLRDLARMSRDATQALLLRLT